MCFPHAEKRCNAAKAKVPRLQSDLSVDGISARQNQADVHKESAEARQPSSCCANR